MGNVAQKPCEQAEAPAKKLSVMICVDESEHEERAFDWYIEHCHKKENDVIIFNAAESNNLTAYTGVGAAFSIPGEPYESISEEQLAKLKELQHNYETKLREHHGHGKVFVIRDVPPGPAICEYARENSIDWIIIDIGSRGQGSLRRTFMGSISDYVLHNVHIPVLVVPPLEEKH